MAMILSGVAFGCMDRVPGNILPCCWASISKRQLPEEAVSIKLFQCRMVYIYAGQKNYKNKVFKKSLKCSGFISINLNNIYVYIYKDALLFL